MQADSPVEKAARPPVPRLPYPLSPVGFAGPDDEPALSEFLACMREELGPVEDAELEGIIFDLTRRIAGAALIVRGPEKIEASLGIKAVKSMLSREHYLKVIWFGVLPEARSSGHAKSLLLGAQHLANALGKPLIKEWMSPTDAPLAKLIARHIPSTGTLFVYQPPTSLA